MVMYMRKKTYVGLVAFLWLCSGAAVMLMASGCLRLISAEPLEDGSTVICVKVDPPPDAGAQDAGSEPIRYRTVPSGLEY